MSDQGIRQHKRMATGSPPPVEGIETPWKSGVSHNDGAGKRALADHMRGMSKRGKDADHDYD